MIELIFFPLAMRPHSAESGSEKVRLHVNWLLTDGCLEPEPSHSAGGSLVELTDGRQASLELSSDCFVFYKIDQFLT